MTLVELLIFMTVLAIMTGAVASMMSNVNTVNRRTTVKLDQRDVIAATNVAFRNLATCTGNLIGTTLPNNPTNSISSTHVDLTSRLVTSIVKTPPAGLYYYQQPTPGVFVRMGEALFNESTVIGGSARISGAHLENIKRYPENAYTADLYLEFQYRDGLGTLAPQKVSTVFLQADTSRKIVSCRSQFSPLAGQPCYYYGERVWVTANFHNVHCGTNLEISPLDGPPSSSTGHIELWNGNKEACHYSYDSGTLSPVSNPPPLSEQVATRTGSCQCFTNSTYNADGLCVRPERWDEIGQSKLGNRTFSERINEANLTLGINVWNAEGPNGSQGSPLTNVLPKYSVPCRSVHGSKCRAPPPFTQTPTLATAARIVEGVAFDFGQIATGYTTQRSITILNAGTQSIQSLTSSSLTGDIKYLGGSYPGTGGSCGTTILPGDSCSVMISFAPTSSISYSNRLTFQYNYNSTTEQVYIDLSGRGITGFAGGLGGGK
jgi:type II secretory pathway pseudopilin PulG